jgi:hypothetical protein
VAQADLWGAGWVIDGLDTEWKRVGKDDVAPDTKALQVTATTWASTLIGAAEATQLTKQGLTAAATKNKDAVTRWKAVADEEAQAAAADVETGRVLLVALTAEIAPLARAEAGARADLNTAIAEQAARLVANVALGDEAVAATGIVAATAATGARAVLDAAAATKASVEAQQAFHDARADWAADNLLPLQQELDKLKAKKLAVDGMVVDAEARFDAAREQCKRAAFLAAQEAREKAQEVAKALTAKQEEVKKAYAAKASFPTDGSAGTLCHYPKKAADAAQEPRKECLEGEQGKPLCCGAAQRFLKDGTKLSIETCQLATDTTYTYYPALPADAVVAPTPETWRFQCISGAQKLAAAAAAALTAGYMMA